MKIGLVIPTPKFHSYLFPLGFGSIYSYLKSKGYHVKLLDLNALSASTDIVRTWMQENKFDILITGSSYKFFNNCPPFNLSQSIEIAQIGKTVSDKTVTIGVGPFNLLFYKKLLEKYYDYVIYGEPEDSLLELLDSNCKGIETIKGIVYKSGAEYKINPPRAYINLDKLPMIDRSDFDMKKYIFSSYFSRDVTNIISSRGCPYNCVYCLAARDSVLSKCNTGSFYRKRDPISVVDEIEGLYRSYNIRGLKFEDIEFCVSKEHVEALCRGIIERGLHHLKWRAVTRVTSMSISLLKLMKQAGCRSIYYGVESGNETVLEKMNKRITKDEILKIFEATRNVGILADASFLFGLPFENRKEILETITFAKQLKANFATFHIFSPYPGIPLFGNDDNAKFTYTIDNYNVYNTSTYQHPTLGPDELQRLKSKAYHAFYFRLSFFGHQLRNLNLDYLYYLADILKNKNEASLARQLVMKR